MSHYLGPQSLNWSCAVSRTSAPPLPGLLAAYVGLLGAPLAVTIWWLWRYLLLLLPPLEQFPDQRPAILREEEEHPRIWRILDEDQIEVAAAAVRGSILSNLVRSHGYLRYPPIHDLEAEAVPDVRLIDLKSMEDMIRELPADAVDMPRQASIHYDPIIGRFLDVVRNLSVLFADPCALATESTEMVIELKTATVVVCLIWRELNEQSRQLCREVKEECFALVTKRSVENLLVVARSFSDANWCSCHAMRVLTIFDTLVDVLYNIQGLPLDRSQEVAGIASNMVNAIRGMLEGTTDDIDSREEFAIHPANDVLVQVLGFFLDNRDELQSMLGTGDHCSDMFNAWVFKLENDAENIFQDGMHRSQRYIFLLNNVCDVEQRPGRLFFPSVASSLDLLIEQYKKSYFDACWVPLLIHLRKSPRRSSLDKFIAEFLIICNGQMAWKVPAELRCKLRQEIVDLIVPPYEEFLRALQANPSRLSEWLYSLKLPMQGKKKQKEYSVGELKELILILFESSDAS